MPGTYVRDSALNVIAGVFTTFGGFLSTIFVARLLGVEGTGVVAFATWIVTVVVVGTDLGIPGTIARFLPELRARGDEEAVRGLPRHLLWRFAIALGIVTVAFIGYAATMAYWYDFDIVISSETYHRSALFWLVVGLACFTQGLAGFTNGYLRGQQSFRLLARIAVLSAAFQITTTLVGSWAFGIAGAMAAAVASSLIPAVIVVRLVPKGGVVAPALITRANTFAWETWGSYLVMAFAWSRMEIFFLERSWGSDAAGLFTVSLTLANLATQVPVLACGALLPYLAQQATHDTGHKACEAYAIGLRLMALVVFPACFGIAALIPTFLPLLYGADFSRATSTAMILVTAAAFSAQMSVAITYLYAMERTRIVLVTGALGAVLLIIVGLVAVPIFGPNAAALGRGAIQVTIVGVAIWYIQARLDCKTPFGSLARLLAAALACGAAALATVTLVPGPAGLLLAIVAGFSVYIVALKLLHALPPDDLERLGAAVALLPAPLGRPFEALLRFIGPRG